MPDKSRSGPEPEALLFDYPKGPSPPKQADDLPQLPDQPATDEQSEPKLREIHLSEIKSSRTMTRAPLIQYPVESLLTRVIDLEKKLNAMQLKIEKTGNPGGPASGNSAAKELNAIVERLETLDARVSEIRGKLQGTLGYDIYHQHKCDKCGSEGYLAAVYKCTNCGGQSWRGWWPAK